MTPLDHLCELIKSHPRKDGWICIKMSNTEIILRHPIEGDKSFYIG